MEHDPLLVTKLSVPRLPAGLVRRDRLLLRLDEAPGGGSILVCAPAGFGKTALLADWGRSSRRPAAWLSLDAGDNDPLRFWRHAVGALDGACPGLAEAIAPLLGPPAPSSFEDVAAAVINDLAARPDEALLVLDDYHLIDSRPVQRSVSFLIEHLPAGVRVALASRSEPPLGLARLRARGDLTEVRATELRFTTDESAALLRDGVGHDLPEAALSALADRTEGWAAGLRLAALSLRGQSDVAGFVATFDGSHRHILDYLTQEVLERQSEQVRTFLLETSVLGRLSGPLCDAVTGGCDGQARLEEIERANLFLVPLDEVRGWWRYHRLFAELLRSRLRRERPGLEPELHRRAAAWYELHGLADETVCHALSSDDPARAARLIERHVDTVLFRGEGATVRRWLEALPADLVASRPRLQLARARLTLLGGQLAAAEASLDAADRALARDPGVVDEPYEPAAGRSASLLGNVAATIALDRAYLAALRGDANRARAFAARALAEAGTDEWMLEIHAGGYLALAEFVAGRLDDAERLLTATVARWLAAGERALAVRGCHHLGQVQRAQGRLDAALGTYHDAIGISTAPGRPVLPAAGVGYVGLAEAVYQCGDLDSALGYAREGIALCRRLVYRQPLADGLATLAWILQVTGDAAGAAAAIDEAARVMPVPEATGPLNPVPARIARLRLLRGEVEAATRWTVERGLDADGELVYAREAEHLVLARVLLRRGRPDRALGLLDRLVAAATEQGRGGSVVEARALRALALAAAGSENAAVAALEAAFSLGSARGCVRVFADEGAPMRVLVERLVELRRRERRVLDDACLTGVLRAVRAGPASAAALHGASGMLETLTARELEVLRLVAAGKPNRRIAADLGVTLDTVKKHVGQILGKLGAANRTEAAARARDLDLIH